MSRDDMEWWLNKNKFTEGKIFGSSRRASIAVSFIASTAFVA
jgi:hypothetical protein